MLRVNYYLSACVLLVSSISPSITRSSIGPPISSPAQPTFELAAFIDPAKDEWVFLCTNLEDLLYGPGSRRKERYIPLPPLKERFQKELEIAQALQYLHENKPKVLNLDLKPGDVFLGDASHDQIADFGHARFSSNEEKALTGEAGKQLIFILNKFRVSLRIQLNIYSFLRHIRLYGARGDTIAMEVAENGLRPAIPKADQQLGELIELIQKSCDVDLQTDHPLQK
ncbi:serine threonine- kinase STY46-like [Olea europaea subsp. europaea]|uniref:Serine threonine- kinase STY46-like n=1 Tax=Olea europaea subsp. europaea TaxID=158383 RepID=A0A8S0UST6_OLEEU|nr:serine threonine- kinase STY46-like [Olea europaea subsp. europaea]